jgi:hypothetical protein
VPHSRRLSAAWPLWEHWFPGTWQARVARFGLRYSLAAPLPPARAPRVWQSQRRNTPAQSRLLDEHVRELLEMGALAPADTARWVSPVFTVPKASGGSRLVVDCRRLNERLRDPPRLRLDDLRRIRTSIPRGWWLTVLDLKSAYHSVPVAPHSQALSGLLHRGALYRWTCLVFGVQSAPWLFTRMLEVVLRRLRAVHGVQVTAYLDDLLVVAPSPEVARAHTALTVETLTRLGFVISPKSQVQPAQSVTYLGFRVDTRAMTLGVTPDKARACRKEARRLAARVSCPQPPQPPPTIRALARTLGRLQALAPGCPDAMLHLRRLQAWLRRALATSRWSWESPLPPPTPAELDELRGWAPRLRRRLRTPLAPRPPRHRLSTDASRSGYGALLEQRGARGQWTTVARMAGRWNPGQEGSQHINELELLTVALALERWAPLVPVGASLELRCDNTVALAYTRRQGGRIAALTALARRVWRPLLARRLSVSTLWLPSAANYEADALSRLDPQHEWTVRPEVLAGLESRWSLRHTVDAFAAPHAALLPRFWTRFPHPAAEETNALVQSWSREEPWCAPPPYLLPAVLHKVMTEGVTATVVCPLAPHARWWPLARRLADRPPVRLDALAPPGCASALTHPLPGHTAPAWPVLAVRVDGRRLR